MADRRRISWGCGLVGIPAALLCLVGMGIVLAVWDALSGQPVAVDAPERARRKTTRMAEEILATSGPPCRDPVPVVSALDPKSGVLPPIPPLPASAQVPDAVDVFLHVREDLRPPVMLRTVAIGEEVQLGEVPCAHLSVLSAELDGERVGQTALGGTVVLPLAIAPVQPIRIVVQEAATGAPVEGAWAHIRADHPSVESDSDGVLRWNRPVVRIAGTPDGLAWRWQCDALQVEVHAEGYASERIAIPGCNGQPGRGGTRGLLETGIQPLEVEVALESRRTLFVHCLRGDEESCPGDLICTPSGSVELTSTCRDVPDGFPEERRNAVRCTCPDVGAVVRGLGRSFDVPDDAEDIWIDLDDAAGVRGSVADFVPIRHSCSVVAERVAADLEDIGSLGAVGRVRGTCGDEDGAFSITGLTEGDWVVELQLRDQEQPHDALRIALPVAALQPDERRDLGPVSPAAGAALEIECEDGLTGSDTRAPLILMVHDGEDFEVGYVQVVTCGHRHEPALTGDWDLFVLPWAHIHTAVSLAPGDDRTVSITVGDDDALEALGGALEPGEGELVVRWVEPGGTLDALGIRPGDALVDIAAFGMPLPMEDYPEAVLSGVLGVWGVAGVEVAVESGETGEVRWMDLDP